ncbi:MAG TPA: nodulation protein NfeD, partial [Geobacteraceae bacterium]|nr:nodulation protein NfeD [Geobacteraceae bacterium]
MRSGISILLLLFSFALLSHAGHPAIRLLEISGPINPASTGYIARNLKESARKGEKLVLIEMDTPGGLDSSMRGIVKEILASPVPVAVYVAPSGSRAASAGAIIAVAADFCVMAPGTAIGAAHPVSLLKKPDTVMQEKIVNDTLAYVEGIAGQRGRNTEIVRQMVSKSLSLPAEKALEENVIDFLAGDRNELIRLLDGKTVQRSGKVLTLELSDAEVVTARMTTREKVLDVIGDPNIAYMLMMLGFLGIFFELSTPGVILPGVVGGISLILAFFAFQTLPVNYAGVLLILLALVLFIAEIKIISHGMLTVGGVIAMTFGSILLFESPEPYLKVSLSLIITTVLLVSGFAFFVIRKAIAAHRRKPTSGKEGLIGEKGYADSDIHAGGRVFVRGEYWDAWSDQPIVSGDRIVVISVDGMRVKVEKCRER